MYSPSTPSAQIDFASLSLSPAEVVQVGKNLALRHSFGSAYSSDADSDSERESDVINNPNNKPQPPPQKRPRSALEILCAQLSDFVEHEQAEVDEDSPTDSTDSVALPPPFNSAPSPTNSSLLSSIRTSKPCAKVTWDDIERVKKEAVASKRRKRLFIGRVFTQHKSNRDEGNEYDMRDSIGGRNEIHEGEVDDDEDDSDSDGVDDNEHQPNSYPSRGTSMDLDTPTYSTSHSAPQSKSFSHLIPSSSTSSLHTTITQTQSPTASPVSPEKHGEKRHADQSLKNSLSKLFRKGKGRDSLVDGDLEGMNASVGENNTLRRPNSFVGGWKKGSKSSLQ
ncbi:hypothetical protein HDU79_009332 [Rhizoclosmatium sp. JEL0117]|nr:hypothetical protein HDU79_009332 [Rhizoclosmatium sp. JEL0117]